MPAAYEFRIMRNFNYYISIDELAMCVNQEWDAYSVPGSCIFAGGVMGCRWEKWVRSEIGAQDCMRQ